MKQILVCGAGGFIGSHLVKKLKTSDCRVQGVDLKYPEFSLTVADDFAQGIRSLKWGNRDCSLLGKLPGIK